MLTGTANFMSLAHARRYYLVQCPGDFGAAERKVASGEITIGPPDLTRFPQPASFHWDRDGRAVVKS